MSENTVNITNVVNAGPQLRVPPKKLSVAYVLWALSWVGVAGVHRFYLGKPGTGILWLLTFGLFFIGTIVDAFTLGRQVHVTNWQNGHGEL